MIGCVRAAGAVGFILAVNGCSSVHRVQPLTEPQPSVAPQREPQGPDSQGAARKSEDKSTQPRHGAQNTQAGWPPPVHDDQFFTFLRAEQLEYRLRDQGPDVARWEAQGWHGGDYQRLWIKTEGEQSVEGAGEGELELQVLYSHVVAPFWDFQVGTRYDGAWGPGPNNDRWFGVVGFQGFSPYEFEVEAALFVSEDADVSVRLTASTDFLITQRLILQPRFETELAAQDVPEFQVGQGLNYIDLGLRLRYEIKREFAPYIGVNWIRSIGESRDLVRQNGGVASDLALVFGISTWF